MRRFLTTMVMSCIFLALTCTITQAQTNWMKYLGSPVLEPGSAGSWDDIVIVSPSIIFDGSIYHMWYNAYSDAEGLESVGYATSSDGITWTKYDDPSTAEAPFAESDPVLNPGPPGSLDEYGVGEPFILLDDTTYHMWYGSDDSPAGNGHISISHATSSDGINWSKDTLNPVLDVGPGGSWDDAWIFGPCVVFDDIIYHMWYYAWNGINDELRIGHATSPDMVTWTKDPNNPGLSFGSPGGWEYPRLDLPRVIYDGDTFHMWYSGGSFWNWRIGYATSPDGSSWTKHAQNPVVNRGPESSWDDTYVGFCAVVMDSSDSTLKMWYTGGSGVDNGQIGYAVDFSQSTIARADSIAMNATYLGPDSDTLRIDARIVNPEDHVLSAKAIIVSEDGSIEDSTDLTMDGELWSGEWPVADAEQNFSVGIKTSDEQSGYVHNGLLWYVEKFTSIGPLEITDYEDSPPFGISQSVYLNLTNLGVNSAALDVSAIIDTDDPRVVGTIADTRDFGDIAPGDTSKNAFAYVFFYAEGYDQGDTRIEPIHFEVTILSEGTAYWSTGFDFTYSGPATVDVPEDYANIQDAINSAIDEDVILVAEGTYMENIDFKGKAITVASHYFMDEDTSHISNTIIDGSNPPHPDSGSVVSFHSGEDTNSVLMGFTITGGSGTEEEGSRGGGGIQFFEAGGKVINSKIIHNTLATGNTFRWGGGLSLFDNSNRHIVIRGNEIAHNTISGAHGWGGGVAIYTKGQIILEDNNIHDNTATAPANFTSRGGGILVDGSYGYTGTVIIRNNRIQDNSAIQTNNNTKGGGIFIHSASPYVYRNVISGNISAGVAGGIHVRYDPDAPGETFARLINNTITQNTAGSGAGIYVSGVQARAVVVNSIVWDNIGHELSNLDGDLTVFYCDVEGGFSGSGNVNEPPALIDAPFYHLYEESPCIDAGHDASIFNDVEDPANSGFALAPALGTLTNDMGAYGGPQSYDDLSALDIMLDLIVDGIIKNPELGIPEEYALEQNYPNPFNPLTTINFSLPNTEFVTLNVYNLLGQQVAALVAENLKAGFYSHQWDASQMASGVYYYELQAGDFRDVRKMVLLR